MGRWLIPCIVMTRVLAGCEGRTAEEVGNDIRREAAAGNVSAVRSMIERDPTLAGQADSFGMTPLHAAAAQGRTQVVQLLLDHKADVNAKAQGGLTPLLSAVAADQADVVALLVERGADVSVRAPDGKTAIELAKARGSNRIIELLQKQGGK
jgi:ankyrin repeat protein